MSYFRRFSERTTLNATASTLSLALLRILLAQYMLMSMPQKLSIFLHGFSIPQFVAFAIATALATSMLLGHYSRTCTFLIGATAAVLYYNQSYGWPTLPFGVKDFSSHTVQRDLIYSAYLGLMLSFTPCGAVLSLDAIHDSKAAQGGGLLDSPAIFGMRTLLITVYFWTALSKCNSDFLSGTVIQTILIKNYLGSFYSSGVLTEMHVLPKMVSIFTVVFEFCLALGLTFKRTRRYAVYCGISMHIAFLLTLPVFHFSFIMISSYLLFVDQEAVEQAKERLLGNPARTVPH